MRKIEIRQKLKPFSKTPGVEVPLCSLELTCRVYPTYLEILERNTPFIQISLSLSKRVDDFVVFLDPAKNQIEIENRFDKQVLNLNLRVESNTLRLLVKRSSLSAVPITIENVKTKKVSHQKLASKESLVLLEHDLDLLNIYETLSLGSHKKQEIESINKRGDFNELLPLYFALGQLCHTDLKAKKYDGNLSFIQGAKKMLQEKKHDLILETLKPLCKLGFSGLLCPHLEDVHHYGPFSKNKISVQSDFILLKEAYQLIRSFLIQSSTQEVYLLPHMPKELVCGRVTHLKVGDLTVHLEWTKKSIRIAQVTSHKSHSLRLHFQKPIQKCRVRVENKSSIFKNGMLFHFEKSKTYYFDRFEK